MTATDQPAAAEISPVIAGAIQLLHEKPGVTIADLAAAVVPVPAADPSNAMAEYKFPDLPKKIILTGKAREALKMLARVFGSVDIETRRALTEQEQFQLTQESETIRALLDVLAKRKDVINEIIRVHMDVDAEQRGAVVPQDVLDTDGVTVLVPASPRDQHGHYLLASSQKPYQVQVGARAWSQEYSSGSAEPSSADLLLLSAAGTVSRQEYLALTREVRALDTERMASFIRKSPARGLEILRMITRRSAPKSSMYLRDVK